MKNIFCSLGVHKMVHERDAVVTSDRACCGKVTSVGEVLKCQNCRREVFRFSSGVEVDLTRKHGLIFIDSIND